MFPLQIAVPTRYAPVVTYSLIAANCIVFLYQISLSPIELEMFLRRFALTPAVYLPVTISVWQQRGLPTIYRSSRICSSTAAGSI
jgi:rhomboid family protein